MKKVALSKKAYDYIKDAIIKGEFKEGDIITENNIGSILNMSRTPVKRALTMLESENYVKSLDGVGTIVNGLSIKDLSDIYEARTLIEVGALNSAINRIDRKEAEKTLIKLKDVLKILDSGGTLSNNYEIEVDKEIHNLIISNTSNNYLKVLMEQIQGQIERYRIEAYKLTNTTESVTLDHIEILEKIIDNDYEGAKKALEYHIMHSFKELSRVLFDLNIM